MSKFRLHPTPWEEEWLELYCSHARYIWNLALEQLNYATRERRMPGRAEQSRQLTEARREHDWLRDVPTVVGKTALQDFQQACTNWWRGSHGRPTWRKAGRHEGFRISEGHGLRIRKLNRRWSQVWIPGLGWLKFRRTREVGDAKSFRVKRDATGRWHIAFAVRPQPIEGPGDGSVVGVDRGVAVTLAYSDGTLARAPRPTSTKRADQALSRCKRGSNRRRKAKLRLAGIHARNANRRRDFVEQQTTRLARRADLIRVEDLRIKNMTRSARGTVDAPGRNVKAKAGLNRSILAGGWGMFVSRLEAKAFGRVEKINPAYTSQTCAVCGYIDQANRKSQAFACRSCGHTAHADINAAQVIAAGRAVRGAEQSGRVEAQTSAERGLSSHVAGTPVTAGGTSSNTPDGLVNCPADTGDTLRHHLLVCRP